MKTKLLIIAIIAFAITACTKPITINRDNILAGEPKIQLKNTDLGTISPEIASALGIKGQRSVLTGIDANGNLSFLTINGNKFNFTDKKPKEKPIQTITIKIYRNSPLCYELDPGTGSTIWVPENCPF